MKNRFNLRASYVALALGAAAVAIGLVSPRRSLRAEPPPPSASELVSQLGKQQEQIMSNQAKIDEQLAALQEELRLLKIYGKRSR